LNPQVKRRRGKPNNTWRRDWKRIGVIMVKAGKKYKYIVLAKDRMIWNVIVTGICPDGR
jgi:hypothetical protein